jgi:8-oxo-dGTP pyrophosphatase MutT (NUDIX family)
VKPVKTEVLYSTPWCEMVAKTMHPGEEPWYSMRGPDYTTIVAVTEQGRILAVRQYRPAVERFVIEFPAGNIDGGESREECARRELVEETGYQAGEMELLGPMFPDVGRLGARVWNFFAPGVRPVTNWEPEPDVEVLSYSLDELAHAIEAGTFNHALHIAALVPAMLRGKLKLGA